LPPSVAGLNVNNNTQTGASVNWSHKLTPQLSVTASGTLLRTVDNESSAGSTKQGNVEITAVLALSPRTSALAGARYQNVKSDVTLPYNEAAVYVGISHSFR